MVQVDRSSAAVGEGSVASIRPDPAPPHDRSRRGAEVHSLSSVNSSRARWHEEQSLTWRFELVDLGVGEAVVEQPFEQVAVGTGVHSILTSFRISARIIFLTSLLAV